jgi:hypothetical protein
MKFVAFRHDERSGLAVLGADCALHENREGGLGVLRNPVRDTAATNARAT